jgi:hypothetical protein
MCAVTGLFSLMNCPGHDHDRDPGRAGFPQGSGRFAACSASGENIVDQEHVGVIQMICASDGKSPENVFPALGSGHTRLRLRVAQTPQQALCEWHPKLTC